MRKKLKRYKFIILSVLVMTGVSITGWTFALNSVNSEKNANSQIELKNHGQVTNLKPLAIDHNNIILVLVCTGLIGFYGIRRQSKTSENVVKGKHSECSSHEISLNEITPERQACRGKLNNPDTVS